MEQVIAACITGVGTLVGVILSDSKPRAVMEIKLEALTEKIEKRNHLIERTHSLEEGLSVVRNDVETHKRKAGRHERVPGKQRVTMAAAHDRAQHARRDANLDLIMGWCVLDPSMRGLVTSLAMAVLSPIMAALGGGDDIPKISRGGARGA